MILSYLWVGRDLAQFGLVAPDGFLGGMLMALGVTWAARIAYRYRGVFQAANVGELLEDMAVSQMRPRAVELKGQVIGHGIPGAVWSADLVLKDETGLMFLYYRSSLPFGRLYFAVKNADRLVGDTVTVRGWYRRGLRPYVEISWIEGDTVEARSASAPATLFGGEDVSAPPRYEHVTGRSYSQWIQLGMTAVAFVAGLVMVLGGR